MMLKTWMLHVTKAGVCSQILSFQSVWLLLVTSFGRDVCREVILPKRHRRIIVKLVSPWGWLSHLSCMQMRGEPQHLYAWNRRVSQSKRKTNPNFQTASDMPGLFPARIISVKTVHDSEILRGTNSKGCTAKQHCDYKKCVNKYWWCQIDYGGDVTFFPYVTRVSKGPFDSRKPCTEQNLSGMVDLLGAWDPQRLGLGLKPFGLLNCSIEHIHADPGCCCTVLLCAERSASKSRTRKHGGLELSEDHDTGELNFIWHGSKTSWKVCAISQPCYGCNIPRNWDSLFLIPSNWSFMFILVWVFGDFCLCQRKIHGCRCRQTTIS